MLQLLQFGLVKWHWRGQVLCPSGMPGMTLGRRLRRAPCWPAATNSMFPPPMQPLSWRYTPSFYSLRCVTCKAALPPISGARSICMSVYFSYLVLRSGKRVVIIMIFLIVIGSCPAARCLTVHRVSVCLRQSFDYEDATLLTSNRTRWLHSKPAY